METTSDSIPEIDGETSPPTRNVESEDFPESGKTVPERSEKVGSGDLPISGESGFMVVESENSPRKKKRILVYGVVGAFVILLVIITVLAAMLARCSSRNESNNNTATEKTTNNVPTLNLQDKIKQVKEHIVSQGYSSSDDVHEQSTPQDLAAQFMGLDDIAVPHKTSSKGETFEWMERYVMTVFYYAMNGDSWVVSNSFVNRNIRTCRWGSPIFQEGVGCDKNGRINSISLERNNLKGTIPSELGLLDYLISFSAADNSISGPIPAWIGKLSTLRYLHLYGNQITGSIPTSINKLNSLIALSLEDNAMTGDLNHITGLRNLAFLLLEDNGFSQKVDSSFLTNLPSLKVLDISDNDFSGAVPVHLFSDGGLNVFDVHGNYLDSFPDAIPDNSTLKFLSMHMNPLSGAFPSTTISSLKNLEHLDLTSTKLEGTMPEELGNVKTLEYLFIADTSFTAGSIPDTFQNLTALVDLSLKHSDRTGIIPSWIHVLTNLVLLDLDSNNLAGGVPREIGNLTDLTFLFLHRNNLEGTVPEELGMAKSLSYLFLDHNSLSGSLDPICNQLTRLRSSTSDCGYPNIEIDCTCCRVCCDDDNVTEACTEIAEHDFLMSLDPHWSTDYKRFEPLKGHTVYYINDFNITRRS